MKQMLFITTVVLSLAVAGSAQAACVVEYKAKRDNPLELFFDETTIKGKCTKSAAKAALSKKLSRKGLKLLKVLSVKKN